MNTSVGRSVSGGRGLLCGWLVFGRAHGGWGAGLTRGAAVRGALRQAERDPMPAISQLVILTAAQAGVFDDLNEAAMRTVMDQIKAEAPVALADIAKQITQGAELDDAAQTEMCALAQKVSATAKGGEDVPIA